MSKIGRVIATVALLAAPGIAQVESPFLDPTVSPVVSPLVAGTEPDGAVGRSYWSLVFDGIDNYASATDASTADEWDVGTGPITIAAWVKVTTVATAAQNILSKRVIGNNTAMWVFNVSTDGYMVWATHNGVGLSTATSTTVAVAPNVWTFVAVVRNGTDLTFYANGASQTISSVRQDNITNTAVVGLGAQVIAPLTAPISGTIGPVRMWRSARSVAQLNVEYANRNPFAVATVTPTWGAAFLPGSGQTITKTWGKSAFTLGSTAGIDTNDPTWGARQFAGRRIQ